MQNASALSSTSSSWRSRFCLLSPLALEEGEAVLQALDASEDGKGGKRLRCRAAAGAFADWTDEEFSKRREGGLKHTEDPSANPCCPRGHFLFHRHHPWVTNRTTTQCSICTRATLPLALIRYHCASKVCGGVQVCNDCSDRYGSETTTALHMAEHLADPRAFNALAHAVRSLRLRTSETSFHMTRDVLRASLEMAAPHLLQHADDVMRFHDEAFNTEAYRAEGRAQSARLARAVQELQQRQRALDRTLRALDRRASGVVIHQQLQRGKRPKASASAAEPPSRRRRAVAMSSSSSSSSSSDDDDDDDDDE